MNNLLNRRVHRNIKPSNILIDKHGELKLSDLGLARDLKDLTHLSSGMAGCEKYYSPEVINGEYLSEKSDVWSYGVVLLELAYGGDALELDEIHALSPKKIISMFKKWGGYSFAIAKFISRCFVRKSTDRVTVKELLKDEWLSSVNFNIAVAPMKSGNNNLHL